MSFPKFITLLLYGLRFNRIDLLGDDWEGTMPAGTAAAIDAEFDETSGPENTSALKASWKYMHGQARESTFASCWQLSEKDVWWMWKVYCETECGVAVRSTYARLEAAVPPDFEGWPFMIGKVRYGDYRSLGYLTSLRNSDGLVMSKRKAFEDEKEVRAVCNMGVAAKGRIGFWIPVNVNELATAIVVSPLSPDWFLQTVEEAARALKCTVPVEHSEIREKPNLPLPLF